MRLGHGGALRRLQMRALDGFRHSFLEQPALRDGHLRTTAGAVGVSTTGKLDRAALETMLAAMPGGTWELVCHPGYHDADLGQVQTRLQAEREIERQALLAVVPALHSREDLQLISFADLPSTRDD